MQLPHGLGLYWRDPDTVQIGFGPRSHILPRLYPREIDMLALFSHPVTRVDLANWALKNGVDSSRADMIYDDIEQSLGIEEPTPFFPDQPGRHRAGLIDEHHRSSHISLTSTGITGIYLARALVSAGIGRLSFTDPHPAGLEEARLLGSRWLGLPVDAGVGADLAPQTEPGPVDLHIEITSRALPHESGARLLAEDTAFLPIVIGESETTIGPLIVPGTSPCLECMRLHATDADPAWPILDLQASRLSALMIDTPSAMMIASWACTEAIAALGGSSRITRHQIVVSPRDWPRLEEIHTHTGCGCSASAIDHRKDR